jgi:phage gp29-like protein
VIERREMDWEQASVEAHNRHEAWADVVNHLRIARECVEQAQCVLDDLGEEDYTAQLDAVMEGLTNALRERGVKV